MKTRIGYQILLILFLAQSSFACEGLINRGILLSGVATVGIESISAATAYSSKNESPLYLWQTGAFGISAITLSLLLLAFQPQTYPKISALLLTSSLAGATVGTIVYHKNITKTEAAKIAFSTSLLGSLAHMGHVIILMLKRACFVEENTQADYNSVV